MQLALRCCRRRRTATNIHMALSARELTLAAWVSVGELTLMHRSLTFDPLLRRLSALRAATIHAVFVQPMVFSLRAAVLRVALPHILSESDSRATPRGCPVDSSRPTYQSPRARTLSARTAICHRFRTRFLSVRADAHRESAKGTGVVACIARAVARARESLTFGLSLSRLSALRCSRVDGSWAKAGAIATAEQTMCRMMRRLTAMRLRALVLRLVNCHRAVHSLSVPPAASDHKARS